jgi:hypothetical protein
VAETIISKDHLTMWVVWGGKMDLTKKMKSETSKNNFKKYRKICILCHSQRMEKS